MASRKQPVDLAANLAKATATNSPIVGKKPTADTTVSVPAGPVQQQPPRPGSPCQKKGCLGRYSILQTTKQGRERLRALICRTCNHQPPEPHRSPL